MQLQASLGLSLMYTRGHSEAATAALNRSAEIARARGDHLNEVRLLGPLFFYYMRRGEFRLCAGHARRSAGIAGTLDDAAAAALAHTLMGISNTLMGDLGGARAELDAAIEIGAPSSARRTIHFGFDHHSWARVARITALCLQGYPAQSRAAIEEAFKDAAAMYHPVSLAVVINSTATLLWLGDLAAAEQHLDWLIARAQSESFAPYLHLGHAFKGELAILRGEDKTGVEILQSRLAKLHAAHYELFTARLQCMLASGLSASGRWTEALSLLDETQRLIDEKGYTSYLPELLRLKGRVLLAMPEHRSDDAEMCLLKSLELSRAQGTRAWELRTATDLARHWSERGRAEDARALLRPVVAQFTEGFDTPDLKAAGNLLTILSNSH
jgi:tetratricopeptide (TPR) repeat protein